MGDLWLVIGSGVTAENVGDLLGVADGVIIASSLKHDGVWWNPVDLDRARHFMQTVARLRS